MDCNIKKRVKIIISFIQYDFIPFVEISMIARTHARRDSALKLVSRFMLTKSTKTLKAICELCKKNYGEDSLVLGRTIFENSLALAFVYKPEPKEIRECIANIFILHASKEQEYMKKNIRDLKNTGKYKEWINDLEKEKGKLSTKELVTEKNLIDKSLAFYEYHIKRYKDYLSSIGKKPSDKRSWSLMSIKSMSKLVGEPYEGSYEFVYTSISKYAHPSVLGSNSCYEIFSQNDELADVENALIISFNYYWRIVYMLNNIYELGLDKEIDLYCSSFVKLT